MFVSRLLLLFALTCCFSLRFTWASEEGVWTTPSAAGYFFTFQEQNDQLLMVVLEPYSDTGSAWQAFFGPHTSATRTASISTLASPLNFQGVVTFTSDTAATLIVSFCVSRTEKPCFFSAGQTVSFTKVF